jgi:hypothetical protein
MLQIASLSVAQDIQGRARAAAESDRRGHLAARDDTLVQGKRWPVRFRTVLRLHRRSVDQIGV